MRNFKKIAISKIDKNVAYLFNKNYIDYVFQKDEKDDFEGIVKVIQELQIQYFNRISSHLFDAFESPYPPQRGVRNFTSDKSYNLPLEEPSYQRFIKKICHDKKIVEYYILDIKGNYLMLSEQGNIYWLIVNNEKALDSDISYAKRNDWPRKRS